MEKSKKNLGMLIIIIVALLGFLIIGGMLGYFLGKNRKQDLQENRTSNNKIQNNLNKKIENNTVDLTEHNQKDTNNAEMQKLENEENYSSIINEYKTAIGDISLKENFDDISEKYKNVNKLMLHYYHNYVNQQFKYTFYDIDNNNVDELIIVSKNSNDDFNNIIDIYTYNGTNPVKLIKENLGERTNAQIFNNGIIYIKGSGGASRGVREFGKISSDGKSFETIKEYYYLFEESGNVTFYSDAQEQNKLDYTSMEQIEQIHLSDATEVSMNSLTFKDITPIISEPKAQETAELFIKAVNEKDWATVEKYSNIQIVNDLKKYNVSNMKIDFSTLEKNINSNDEYYYRVDYDIDYNNQTKKDLSLGTIFMMKKEGNSFIVTTPFATGY